MIYKKFFLLVCFLLYQISLSSNLNNENKQNKDTLNKINSFKKKSIEINLDSLRQRLEYLNQKTTIEIEYTPYLEQVVIDFLKNKQETYYSLYDLSEYYFPIFEDALQKSNLPLELKYLPIVESSLRPRVKSRVGATGLWQFMFYTGREMGLEVNSYVDERMDPLKSSLAASKYLAYLHKKFQNWPLTISAYNAGPRTVIRGVRNSGYNNFWNMRAYLPKETAEYFPSLIATMYLFEYGHIYGIQKLDIQNYAQPIDTISISEKISFTQVSDSIKIPKDSLIFLNPSYVHSIIPKIKNKKFYLKLPKQYTEIFLEKEENIYAAAATEYANLEKPQPELYYLNSRVRYSVVNGDYLGKIANKYGVKVSEIRTWNKLKNDKLNIGDKLIIYPKKFPKK